MAFIALTIAEAASPRHGVFNVGSAQCLLYADLNGSGGCPQPPRLWGAFCMAVGGNRRYR